MPGDDGEAIVGRPQWQRVQAVLDELADADELQALVAQAQADARARVRAILVDALTKSMLGQIGAAHIAPSPRSSPAVTRADRTGLGIYVYGVLAAAECSAVPELAGIDAEHPVSTLPAGELAALVSHVSLDEFDEENLREHLGDMAWVEHVARGHEAVLEAAAAAVTVIPMRMCSIFRAPEGVAQMLQREADAMRSALHALAGKREWGVKVVIDPEAVRSADDAPGDEPQTGAGYLQARARSRAAREQSDGALAEFAQTIHAELSALSTRSLMLAHQRPEVSGHRGDMLLNGAYLVADAGREAFAGAVERLGTEAAARGITLHETGPWPPYNFVPDSIGAVA